MKNWFKKRKKDEIAKIYNLGYKAGYEAGKRESIFKQHTPNQIREACGLAPIMKGDDKYGNIF